MDGKKESYDAQISGRSAWHGSVRADRIWDPGPGGRCFRAGRKTESYAGCDPAGGSGADEQRQFGQSDRSGTIC